MARKRSSGAILAGTMLLGSAATGASQVSAAGPYQTQNYQQNNMQNYGNMRTVQNFVEDNTNQNVSNRLIDRLQNEDIDVQNNKASSVMNKIRSTLGNNLRIKGKFGAPDEFVRIVDMTRNISNRDNLADEFSFTIHARGKQLLVGAMRVKDNQQYSNVRYNFYVYENNNDLAENGSLRKISLNQLKDRLNNFFAGTGYTFDNNFDLKITTNVNQMFAERQYGYNQGINYGFNQGSNYGYSQAYTQAANTLMQNPIFSQMMANSWMMYQNAARQNMYNQIMYNNMMQQNMQNYMTPNNNVNNQAQRGGLARVVDNTFYDKSGMKYTFRHTGGSILDFAGREFIYDAGTDKFYIKINGDSKNVDFSKPISEDSIKNVRPLINMLKQQGKIVYGNITDTNISNTNINTNQNTTQNTYNQNNNWQYQNMYNQNNNWQYQNMYNQNYWQNAQQNNQNTETKLEANSIISDDTYLDKASEKDKFLVTKNGKELRIKGHGGIQLVYDAENDEFKEIKNRNLDWRTAEPDGKPYESQGEFFRGLIDILQKEGKLVRSGRIIGENNFKDKDGVNNYFEIQDNGKRVFINFHNNTPVVYDCTKDEFYAGNLGQKQKDVDMTKPTEFGFIRNKFNPLINKLKAQNKIFKGVRIEGNFFYAENGNKYEYSVDQDDNVQIRRVLTENDTNVLITNNLNAPSAVATYTARWDKLDIEGDESEEDFKPLINYLKENKIIGERIDWDNGKFHTKNGKSYDFKIGKDNRLYLKDASGKCFVYDSKKSGLAQGNFDTEQTTSNFISDNEANTVLKNVTSLIENYKVEGFSLTSL